MTSNRRLALGRLCAATTAVCAMWGALPAAAQERWPAKPVRMVVPFAAGGGGDTLARMMLPPVGAELGRQLVRGVLGSLMGGSSGRRR